jgi:hypothetical protein
MIFNQIKKFPLERKEMSKNEFLKGKSEKCWKTWSFWHRKNMPIDGVTCFRWAIN